MFHLCTHTHEPTDLFTLLSDIIITACVCMSHSMKQTFFFPYWLAIRFTFLLVRQPHFTISVHPPTQSFALCCCCFENFRAAKFCISQHSQTKASHAQQVSQNWVINFISFLKFELVKIYIGKLKFHFNHVYYSANCITALFLFECLLANSLSHTHTF